MMMPKIHRPSIKKRGKKSNWIYNNLTLLAKKKYNCKRKKVKVWKDFVNLKPGRSYSTFQTGLGVL